VEKTRTGCVPSGLLGIFPAVNVLLGERADLAADFIGLLGREAEDLARGPHLFLPLRRVLLCAP